VPLGIQNSEPTDVHFVCTSSRKHRRSAVENLKKAFGLLEHRQCITVKHTAN
jgi:hypothetical protein